MSEGLREIDFLKWKLSEVEKENYDLKRNETVLNGKIFQQGCLMESKDRENAELKKDVNFKNEMQRTLEEKIFELKAKLEKKRVPPRETPVRSRFSGLLCYSMGSLTTSGSLEVSKFPKCYDSFDALNEWEK